jgi:hypothetical protein
MITNVVAPSPGVVSDLGQVCRWGGLTEDVVRVEIYVRVVQSHDASDTYTGLC